MLEEYNKQFDEYVSRGVLKEVSLEAIEDWKKSGGHVHYVAHHGVENPNSLSTKLRIVVDSSLKNNNTGPTLSSLYCKGPNYINNLYNVLTQWRSFPEVGVYDLAKAYHSMETTEAEFYMRLVVWRKEDGEWVTYGHTVVGMGDPPAAVFLELAKEKAAQLGVSIDELLAEQLVPMSYVDDGLLGGSKEDVKRMKGEVYEDEDGILRFTGTLAQTMSLVGMRPKNFVVSGETDPRCLEKQGKVLGLLWNPTEDTISFKLTVNVTPRKGAGRVGKDLTIEDLSNLDNIIFTRRICLQVAAFNFDPLGLISAFLVKLKIGLKELVALEYTWDQPLEDSLQTKWRGLVREMLEAEELKFPRSITHHDRRGRPEIIVYADGSTVAYGSVLYIRWDLDPGLYYTTLVTSKSRVTPKSGLTPPRSEIQGLVVAIRLASQVLKYHDVKPRRVTVITDSECSVSACDLNANSLATFFSNRVLEIVSTMREWGDSDPSVPATQELSNQMLDNLGDTSVFVDLIQHTAGELNPADWPTRGNVSWKDLGPGSEWQDGPGYLHSTRDKWPITRDFVSKVPIEERRKKFLESEQALAGLLQNNFLGLNHLTVSADDQRLIGGLVDKARTVMGDTDSLTKARMVMARVIALFMKNVPGNERDTTAVADVIPRSLQDQAEWVFQLTAQIDLFQDARARENLRQSYSYSTRDRVSRIRGRLDPEDMMRHTGFDSLVLLPYKSRFAFLIMRACHWEDHRASAGDALFRSRRRGYWIIQGRKLAKKVVSNCTWCKLQQTLPYKQKMADLPRQVFDVPTRPFTNVCIDFTGAVKIVDQVKRRTTGKAFPLVFVCINTGAIHLQLAEGYSAADFITQWEHFCSIRGVPVYAHTDMGSQLTSVSKRLEVEIGDIPHFPWHSVARLTNPYGTEFRHCPTQSQWRNGRAEAAVKALKKTMKHMYKGGRLTYAEFSCLLSKCASVINDRPLGVRHHGGAEGGLCVITPNLLLQGGRTCSGHGHSGDFKTDMDRISTRMRVIEESFRAWWQVWFDVVFESLVPLKQWKTVHRNVRVGDIVLVKYESKLKDPVFRRGRVTAVEPDKHGLVRDVTVATQPKVKKEAAPTAKIKRPVEQRLPIQRLVVLLPVEEIDGLPPADDSLHLCEEELRLPDVLQRDHDSSPGDSPPAASPQGTDQPLPPTNFPPDDIPDHDTPSCDFRPPLIDPRDRPDAAAKLASHCIQLQPATYTCWECEVRDQFYYIE